ncbi:hypothetical protein M0802_015383 [Mischocyttarus mexicanus]|nr:hypothetical protein M0802_015383 [Mischocyttarus mexicanus]
MLLTKHPPIMTSTPDSTHRGPLHLLLGTSVVNAHIVYQRVKNKKIGTRKLRELLVAECLSSENSTKARNVSHKLEIRTNQQGKPKRRTCDLCYQKRRQTSERQEAKKM